MILLLLLLLGSAQAAPSAGAPGKEYYDRLKAECRARRSRSCCEASLEAMRAGGYRLAAEGGPTEGPCPQGQYRELMKCSDSLAWCVPETAGPPASEGLAEGPDCSPAGLSATGFKKTESRVRGKVLRSVCSPLAEGHASCATTLLVQKVFGGCVPAGSRHVLRHTRGEPPPDDSSGGSFRFDGFKKGTAWEYSLCWWKAAGEWAPCVPVPSFRPIP